MKLSKAIKNLIRGREDCGMIPSEEYTATIDLATEASKRLQKLREDNAPRANFILPGETPEEESKGR